MAEAEALRKLRMTELNQLKVRVTRRRKLKSAPKRMRRVAGIDIVTTMEAGKAHAAVCLVSFPRMQTLEEAIATDEIDRVLYADVGNAVFVPLIMNVLKMLKRSPDVIVVRELSLRDEIPISAYVGVIAGKPSIGVSERGAGFKARKGPDRVKVAGPVKIRGHRTPLAVIAGHLITFKDAERIVKSLIKETRMPDPVRGAGLRVRAWEREWRRLNLSAR